MEVSKADAYRSLIWHVFDIKPANHFDHFTPEKWSEFVARHEETLASAVESLDSELKVDVLRSYLGLNGEMQKVADIRKRHDVSTSWVHKIYQQAYKDMRRIPSLGLIANELWEAGYRSPWIEKMASEFDILQKLSENGVLANTVRAATGQFLIDHEPGCSVGHPCVTCRARQLLREHGIEDEMLALYELWCTPNVMKVHLFRLFPHWNTRSRKRNCIKFHGIQNLEELKKFTRTQLLKSFNFSEKTLEEMEEDLRPFGIVLKE